MEGRTPNGVNNPFQRIIVYNGSLSFPWRWADRRVPVGWIYKNAEESSEPQSARDIFLTFVFADAIPPGQRPDSRSHYEGVAKRAAGSHVHSLLARSP